VVKGSDVITGPELRHSGTCLYHHSGGLVTVDARRRQEIVFNLFEIRVANTARLYGDEDFARADIRDRDGLDSNRTVAAINSSAH